MTCIVGLAEKGIVWIGGDSAATNDSGLQVIRDDPKVFFLNLPGPCSDHRDEAPTLLAGGTTSFRFLQLLQYTVEVPPYDRNIPIEKYLVTDFVDSIRECLKKRGYDKKDDGEEQGGDLLIGYDGTLYHIAEDYQVGRPSIGYHAVGGGDTVALGVMFATQNLDMPPKVRITLALEAAAYHCRGVRPPFLVEKIEPVSAAAEETRVGRLSM